MVKTALQLNFVEEIHINPFQRLGDHPLKYRLWKKKSKFLKHFGCGPKPSLWDFFFKTQVVVTFTSGKSFKFEARSKAHAEKIFKAILELKRRNGNKPTFVQDIYDFVRTTY